PAIALPATPARNLRSRTESFIVTISKCPDNFSAFSDMVTFIFSTTNSISTCASVPKAPGSCSRRFTNFSNTKPRGVYRNRTGTPNDFRFSIDETSDALIAVSRRLPIENPKTCPERRSNGSQIDNSPWRAHVDRRWRAHGDSAGLFRRVHYNAHLCEGHYAAARPAAYSRRVRRVSQPSPLP